MLDFIRPTPKDIAIIALNTMLQQQFHPVSVSLDLV
jgi:hypothetical protein